MLGRIIASKPESDTALIGGKRCTIREYEETITMFTGWSIFHIYDCVQFTKMEKGKTVWSRFGDIDHILDALTEEEKTEFLFRIDEWNI